MHQDNVVGGYYTNQGEYIPKQVKEIKWCCPKCRADYMPNEVSLVFKLILFICDKFLTLIFFTDSTKLLLFLQKRVESSQSFMARSTFLRRSVWQTIEISLFTSLYIALSSWSVPALLTNHKFNMWVQKV